MFPETEVLFLNTNEHLTIRAYFAFDMMMKSNELRSWFLDTISKVALGETVADIPEPIRNLFEYINSGTVSDRLTQRIDDAVMIAGRNSDEMEESMRFEMLLADAEISEYDKGVTAGRTEGIKEGIKEGMLTGRTKECFEIATRLIESGMKPDKIAKICGISIDTVKRLRDGNTDIDPFPLQIS